MNSERKAQSQLWDGMVTTGKQQSAKIKIPRGKSVAEQMRREMGRRSVGQEWRRQSDFLEAIRKKHNRTSLFQFYFKTTIMSGSQVSTPLQLKLALQVFHSFRLLLCVTFKPVFPVVNKKSVKKNNTAPIAFLVCS